MDGKYGAFGEDIEVGIGANTGELRRAIPRGIGAPGFVVVPVKGLIWQKSVRSGFAVFHRAAAHIANVGACPARE